MKKYLIAALAAVTLSGTAALSATIEQNTANNNYQIQYFSPIGQSFTALDTSVSVGFDISPINTSFAAGSITVNLLDGDGTGGSVLGTLTQVVTTGFSGFFDFDFTSIALTVGQSYTAMMSATTPYWAVRIAEYSNPYAGGQAYFQNSFIGSTANSDLAFRVVGTTAPVPLPAGLPLLLSGFGLLGWMRARRKAA